MLRSLFAGISGLRVNQTMLDVTGNNIANANTVGFKSSQTVFSDTLSQMLTAASAPSSTAGGRNAIQIGLGVQLAAVNTNFTQGSDETTGVATDMMINGDGFFVVNDGQNNYLTRAGAFSFDTAGNLVAPDGKRVMGYPAGTSPSGTPDNDPGLTPLNIDDLAATAISSASLPAGTTLQSYEIGSDGTISTGDKLALGTISVATVRNPQGLEKSGDTEFVESANSGQIYYATAGGNTPIGQTGKLTTGALEMSNVDLAAEFTNLILAQRGFEASSKVITTSDQVLDDLVQMKR
jgi:flagellar hook protein FlgE